MPFTESEKARVMQCLGIDDVADEQAVELLTATIDELRGMIGLSAGAYIDELNTLVPGLSETPDDQKMSKIVDHLSAVSDTDDEDAGGPNAIATLSRAEIHTKAGANRQSWKAESQQLRSDNTTLRKQVQELSARVVKDLDKDAQDLAIDSARVKYDNLVMSGAITPSVKDRLFTLLVQDGQKANTLGLSRAANPKLDKPLAFALADILSENRPVEVGERTGIQVLSRTPEKTFEETSREEATNLLNKYATAGNAK